MTAPDLGNASTASFAVAVQVCKIAKYPSPHITPSRVPTNEINARADTLKRSNSAKSG